MANWDHLSNIGTHPVLDPDPAVRKPHVVAAADREIAKFSKIRDETVGLLGRTVTVTIGRNVGSEPMPAPRWEEFRSGIRQTLANLLCPDFSASYDGTGEWDGVAEDSTLFVASGITREVTSTYLRAVLAQYADEYDQDAIALTVGTTDLVTP
jgi:hypothetical protein